MDESKEIQDILESEARVDAFCDALEEVLAEELNGLVEQLEQAKDEQEASGIIALIALLPKSQKVQAKISEVIDLYTAELEAIKRKYPVTATDAETAIGLASSHTEIVTAILQESCNKVASQLSLNLATSATSPELGAVAPKKPSFFP